MLWRYQSYYKSFASRTTNFPEVETWLLISFKSSVTVLHGGPFVVYLNIKSLDTFKARIVLSRRLSQIQVSTVKAFMPSPLLTSLDSEGHVHLVVGSNPLASARCAKSLEVGAQPIVIAPQDADVHYVLAKRIEVGEVKWTKKSFEDTDLSTFGRNEVEHIVDAVFVTSGGKGALGEALWKKHEENLCSQFGL